MNRVSSAPFELLLALLAVLTLWAVVATTPLLTASLGAVLPLAVGLVFVPDLIDLGIRLACRRHFVQSAGFGLGAAPSTALEVGDFTPYQKRLHLRPFAIVASVRNLGLGLTRFLEAYAGFEDRLWVIDDHSTDGTGERLVQAGIRCVAGATNRRKPGAIRELLKELPAAIETVLVVDPDTHYTGRPADLEVLLFDFQRSGMQAFTPRIDARPDGLVATLQRLEYFIGLSIGRKSLDDTAVNSGVAIYRRQDLQAALDTHSLSVYAEDLETSLILLGQGGRIYYDDRARFETEGMRTLSALFSQRVGWSYGLLRTLGDRSREVRQVIGRGPLAAYQFGVYLVVLGVVLQPLRLVALIPLALSLANGVADLAGLGQVAGEWAHPGLFLAMFGEYLLLAVVGLLAGVPREARLDLLPVVPLYPFYVLLLVVPITIGYLNWVSLRLFGWRIYRDHYQDESSLVTEVNGYGADPES